MTRNMASPDLAASLKKQAPINQRAIDLEQIRKYDRAGFTEHNSTLVARLKREFFEKYGQRV